VAPQPIENALVSSKFIDQALVIGDRRKFCSALIVPDREMLQRWAEEQGIQEHDFARLLAHPQVEELFRSEIDRLMVDFAGYEQVKKFRLLPEPFTIEQGELTPTLKTKRKVVEEKYAELIESMYRENSA
jgi:long-chain acyl-CoA synthetase